MGNSILQSYVANVAGRTVGGLGAAGLPTAFAYQQKYSRSFLPFMGQSKVSQAAAEAGGVAPELGYEAPPEFDGGDGDGDGPSFPSVTSGDRIVDKDNDGIPDHINLIQGSGDTFRVLETGAGVMADLAAKYDLELELEQEEKLEKELSVSGVTSKLKGLVEREAGKMVGIPDSRFDMVTGRDVISGGIKTGVPMIDFLQPVGQKIYDKFILPDLEAAAAGAAMGKEGYGIFTQGGGSAVGITPEGIVGDPSAFLDRTGRSQEQLENEMRDLVAAGQGSGYLAGLYQSYTQPSTPFTDMSADEYKGRLVYENMILGSTLSDELKSDMLGGADLRPTVTGTDGTTYTGFAGTVRFDASTGEVVQDSTPTGPYYESDVDLLPDPPAPMEDPYDDYVAPNPTYTSWDDGDDDSDWNDDSSSGSSGNWNDSYTQDNYEQEAFGGGGGWGDWGWAEGGKVKSRVRMAYGGDPVQGTGFVTGSPDNYTKSETVADTEFRRVREGSYVLNAPTVERLQKQGKLPSGVDKQKNNATIKASGGGKLIDVALSKGELVLEPEDAERIGYDVLDSINDQGKPEVDRRQANMGGRIGLAGGGEAGMISPGRVGFMGMIRPPLVVTGPSSMPADEPEPPKSFMDVPQESFLDVGVEPTTQTYKKFNEFESLSADLLTLLEGNSPKAYVPNVGSQASDISGVTVGLGFDIGQHSVTDLEKMGLNANLISKLIPYVNKRGDSARAVLSAEPLELDSNELEEVNTIVLKSKLNKFNKDYPEYSGLRDIDKAVMFSNAYSGSLGRYKTFRNVYSQARNMQDAIKKGLINRISRGDPERNRAAKALEWYAREQTKRMPLPKPRPNLSATR